MHEDGSIGHGVCAPLATAPTVANPASRPIDPRQYGGASHGTRGASIGRRRPRHGTTKAFGSRAVAEQAASASGSHQIRPPIPVSERTLQKLLFAAAGGESAHVSPGLEQRRHHAMPIDA